MDQLQMDVTPSAGVISFESIPASVDEMLHQDKARGKNDILFARCE